MLGFICLHQLHVVTYAADSATRGAGNPGSEKWRLPQRGGAGLGICPEDAKFKRLRDSAGSVPANTVDHLPLVCLGVPSMNIVILNSNPAGQGLQLSPLDRCGN